MIEIKREKYLSQLANRINNGMIKVITGLRRSGKSYLLNKLFYNYLIKKEGISSDRIIRFAFDSARDLSLIGEDLIEIKKNKRKVSYQKFLNYINTKTSDDNHFFILLDEVQELEGFEYVLNGLLSRNNFDIYVTGSNAKFLARDIITEFRGRGDKIHILPLSFSECWNYYDNDKRMALQKYMIYGGLPYVVLAKDDEERINYIDTQIRETYFGDIIERYAVRNTIELEALFNILASGISGLVNPKKLSSTFKSVNNSCLTEDTIAKYIQYFEDSFLVNIANRYDVKGKKYISTPYKIYFEDLGIRNTKINFRQSEYNHIMENVIYNELRYRGFNVDVGDVELRETNKQTNKQTKTFLEVDFVANKGSARYYIQSAYSIESEEKNYQEIRPLRNINDSFKKIVVVYDYIVPHHDDTGILYVSLEEFLSNPNSLEL